MGVKIEDLDKVKSLVADKHEVVTVNDSIAIVIKEQQNTIEQIERIFEVFKASDCKIRPHFIMTGPSGSGKSHIISTVATNMNMTYFEINGAQLTKEGTAGNSLSKALVPLIGAGSQPIVCFVDEFDKLFISGNTNSDLSHETFNGVQNEFLKVLESDSTSVFGDYGKYNEVPCDNVLFVFAGAFNGETNLTIDRLRDFGIKTEFLGRVGLVFNLEKLSLESMRVALENSKLLDMYMDLFHGETTREDAISKIFAVVERVHDKNTLGIRLLNTLINQYFINSGQLETEVVDKVTFSKKLSWSDKKTLAE